MKPHDNIPDPRFFPAEDSPIPLPPVDESWTLLQKRLDKEGKRRGIAWWWMLAGILAGGLVLWTGARYFSGSSSVRSHPQASVPGTKVPGHDGVASRTIGANTANGSDVGTVPTGAGRLTMSGKLPPAGGNLAMASGKPSPAGGNPAIGSGKPPTAGGSPVIGFGKPPTAGGNLVIGSGEPPMVGGNPVIGFGELPTDGGNLVIGSDEPAMAGEPLTRAEARLFFDETDRHPPITMGAAVIDTALKRNKRGLWMTAGLTLLQNAPLGNQVIYDYNINGKGDLASDYIPAPYFQYFLRSNLYVAVALRWNSPQYTPSLPIDSPRMETGPKQTVFTTSTLQKLYYTDLPLTIGYSPLAHLFLGGGIQYSGLRGGFVYQRIVSYDSVSLLPIVYRTGTLSKRMEETLQLRRTDWRVLLEANYYWNRFSLGLRYQQALGDFRRTGGSGEKNNALGFYLQYNLWEHRRKND